MRGTQTEHHIVPATNLPATMIRGPAACPAPHARHATQGNCGLSGKIKHLHQELCESVTEGDNTKMGALEPAGER